VLVSRIALFGGLGPLIFHCSAFDETNRVSFEGIPIQIRVNMGDLELCFGTRPGKCLHITHEESIATNLGLIVPQTGQRTDHSTMSTASKVADVLQKALPCSLRRSSLDGRRIGGDGLVDDQERK